MRKLNVISIGFCNHNEWMRRVVGGGQKKQKNNRLLFLKDLEIYRVGLEKQATRTLLMVRVQAQTEMRQCEQLRWIMSRGIDRPAPCCRESCKLYSWGDGTGEGE